MPDDEEDDDWEKCDEGPRAHAAQGAEVEPQPKRLRLSAPEDTEEYLMQSLQELGDTDDTGLDALISALEEAPERAGGQECPADARVEDLINSSLAEKKKTSLNLGPGGEISAESIHITSRTYHHRKGAKSHWTEEESRRFQVVLQQYGTNFTLLETFFPTHSRREIKQKFLREDKKHPGSMTDLLKDHRKIDMCMYEHWKEKAQQLKKEAQEKEMDDMEMPINENELLAELGAAQDPLDEDPAGGPSSSAGQKAVVDDDDAAAAHDSGKEEEAGELLDGFLDELPEQYSAPGDVPLSFSGAQEDAVEYYD